MARTRNRLTPMKVKAATDGWYNDGGNLHFRVANDGRSKKWVLRYARDGKVTEIGLGGADRVSLKLARELRDQHLEVLEGGLDPRRRSASKRRLDSTARRSRKRLSGSSRNGGRAGAPTPTTGGDEFARRMDQEPDGRLQADQRPRVEDNQHRRH